jgi:toxin ParE1/3/4
MSELDLAIDRIEEAPRRWPVYLGGTRRYLLRRFPFFVVFRDAGDSVQIVALAHARRRPGYWLGR